VSLPRLSVRRPVAVAMAFLAIVLLGWISFTRLPVDLLPDVSYPRLVIYTSYPEVAPAEVERQVTRLVEANVAAVPGVERLTSVSREGMSLVTLRFAWGTNMEFAMLGVRERLDNVRGSFPETASRPRILRVDPESEPVIVLSAAGPDLWETKELAENVIRRRLEQLDGVAQAVVTGGREREIQVEVDPARLEAHGLTIQALAAALGGANVAAPGGTVLDGSFRYPLRTLGEFRSVAEIEDVVVARQRSGTAGGPAGAIHVRDIARVIDGFADREAMARYNGHEAVGILLFKEAGANTVLVARMVDEVIGLLRTEFAEVELDVAYSQAGFIAESIDNVVSALVLGGMLAFLVLFLFLRQPRYPVAVALAIPISVIATFGLMDMAGVSLNIMSLGGLALGVGMLVDNSIIVLENVFRHREAGADAAEAAARGAEEVTGAITAATLTTIAVFLPIIYVEGVAGQLFRDLSLAVAFSLGASLLVALALLPSLAARFRTAPAGATRGPGPLMSGPRPAGRWRRGLRIARAGARLPLWLARGAWAVARELARFWARGAGIMLAAAFRRPLHAFDRGFAAFAARYHALLDWSLDHRARVLGSAALVLGAALLLALLLERDLLPRVDQGAFEVAVELPQGATLERTAEAARAVEAVLLADADVEAVFSQIGRDVRALAAADQGTGLNTARLQVRVREHAGTAPVVARLREPLRHAAAGAELAIQTGQATALGRILGGADADIAVRIRGEDLDGAFAYADAVAARLAPLGRIDNVRVDAERGQPQFEVEVLRGEAASYRIEPAAVASAVEHGMRGTKATDFAAFDRKVPVMVKLPAHLRHDVGTLQTLRVAGVPLGELIRIEQTLGPAEVRRENQARVVTVFADVRRGGLDRALADVDAALAALPPPPGLRVAVGGENEEMRRSFRDLAFAFGLALLLVYMILAAQFESFSYPFTILAAVPLALIGAILALALAGEGINTMSLIGVVILIGIVVNDSIVKVDFIVQARARGSELRHAILEAGRVRLRPIIMTTATTVLGLTPMALGLGAGADLRAPLAIAVIGGLIVATLLTLIVVPVLFSVIASAREPAGGVARAPDSSAAGATATAAGTAGVTAGVAADAAARGVAADGTVRA
jgi:hydrophobic/amphiphilic exporter-1 (mainly G- bacteria), HAE1 family